MSDNDNNNNDNTTVTEYVHFDALTALFNLNDTEDYKDVLYGIIFDANQEIDNVLLPFADKIPVPSGDELFSRGRKLATAYARVLWALELRQYDLVKELTEIYNEKKKTLIATLKASRTNRTRRATVGTQYRTRRLFSQVKRY